MFFLLGHDVGRPLFGARYYGGTNEVRHLAYHCCFFRHRIQCFFCQELLLTYGVDGKVCVWDSYPTAVTGPVCTLISHDNYPIYAIDIRKEDGKGCLAVSGGSDGGFLGVPVYLHDI
jgi:WD40 repeat protein